MSGLGLDTSTGTVAVNTCAVDSASISLSVLDRYGSFISEHLMSQSH